MDSFIKIKLAQYYRDQICNYSAKMIVWSALSFASFVSLTTIPASYLADREITAQGRETPVLIKKVETASPFILLTGISGLCSGIAFGYKNKIMNDLYQKAFTDLEQKCSKN